MERSTAVAVVEAALVAAEPLVQLQVDIYESKPYPVVRHIFIGKTKEEAMGYYKAHLKTDAFLAGCKDGKYKDIECRTEVEWL